MSRNVQSKLWREIRFVLGRVQKKSRNIRKHGYLRQAANENIWHHIFRESFRTGGWKSELRLNMGRWAAGPAFFYVLHRILEEVQPQHVVELGLGESSKLISKFAEHGSFPASHVIVEHSQKWIDAFQSRFKLSRATSLLRLPLKGKVKNKTPQQAVAYDRIPKDVWAKADLVLVDAHSGAAGIHATTSWITCSCKTHRPPSSSCLTTHTVPEKSTPWTSSKTICRAATSPMPRGITAD